MSAFLCIVKRSYVPATDDNEELYPGNIEALQYGLEALQKQDAQDYVRMQQCWDLAFKALALEAEDDMGAGATGKMQMDDDFEMAGLNDPCRGGWYGW